MKTILLVIDGMTPRRDIFDYALQFCQRVRAELRVLQIVNIRHETLTRLRQKAGWARNYFERTMMAASFAEANAPEYAQSILNQARENTQKILPEINDEKKTGRYAVIAGELGQETVDYVKKHPNIIVAILDDADSRRSATEQKGREPASAAIHRQLHIPLVIKKA